MTTKQAIQYTASHFISREEKPSETDIRLILNDLVDDHDYAQNWSVKQVKARLRKYAEAIG